MKPAEVRAKGEKELEKLVEEKRGTLFGLKVRLATGQLKETSQIRETKRDIARLLTIVREKNLQPLPEKPLKKVAKPAKKRIKERGKNAAK